MSTTIGTTGSYKTYTSNGASQASSTTVKEGESTASEKGLQEAASQDTYVKSTEEETKTEDITYSDPNKLSAEQLKQISEQRIASFKKMLQNMLGKQVDTLNKALFENISITPEERQAAADAIAPGGEWSPENVAQNILNMAKALSGGDVSKLDLLKNAVIQGFAEAEKVWGGKLPDITDQTYDLVMKGFDEWAAEAAETEDAAEASGTEAKGENAGDTEA